ncbi:MAG: enolase C-terminal domain-like protein [Bryobacteraceae bacterium]
MEITRRSALGVLAAAAVTPALAFQQEKSKLKITGVRIVSTRPRHPAPVYTPAPGAWSTGGVEVASPMSIYPEYKSRRSLFMADTPEMGGFTVEISTDKGVKGYGHGGPAGALVVEKHLTKLLIGEDPFNVERIWDILWRSTMSYGRAGVVINAISGVDLALWDLIGNALGQPVYRLLGGETKARIPAYCTGNDVAQHIAFGFQRLKLAIPYGPADGKPGMQKNADLVQRTREQLGGAGDIMLDCWMSWTERYTLEMAELLAPYKVYWMEECLQPHDYEGFGRLNAEIKSTRIATGEHEYTRYGFRRLLEHRSAGIWQPDVTWCGGMTELRRIGALAAAYDIPVIPHAGGLTEAVHFVMATTNSPWAELSLPPPGGPKEVYDLWSAEYNISKGPEGIYMRPRDKPGFGWDFDAA